MSLMIESLRRFSIDTCNNLVKRAGDISVITPDHSLNERVEAGNVVVLSVLVNKRGSVLLTPSSQQGDY